MICGWVNKQVHIRERKLVLCADLLQVLKVNTTSYLSALFLHGNYV